MITDFVNEISNEKSDEQQQQKDCLVVVGVKVHSYTELVEV